MVEHDPQEHAARRQAMVAEKVRAARASVLAGAVLTGLKLAAGLWTGSLGLLAEAVHSALDFGAAVMTLFAVRVSSKPPDREHHFGHGKLENLTALGESALLVVTSFWILWEAGQRLWGTAPHVEASVWGFVVIGISIVVDVVRSRDLMRVARKSGSQALEADALHFSTDIASSAVVLVGLGCVWGAQRLSVPWLALGDAVAAGLVALIVLVLSWRLGKRAADMLLDRAPPGLAETVERAVLAQPGLSGRPQIRLRQAGDQFFAQLTVCLDRGLPIAEGERVSTELRRRASEVLGEEAQVAVQWVSPPNGAPSPRDRLATAVAMAGVTAHDIMLRHGNNGMDADFHLELPPEMPLSRAHEIADEVELRVRQEVPEIDRVDVHLEPSAPAPETATPVDEALYADLEARARAAAAQAGVARLHDLHLMRTAFGLHLSAHCELPPDTPIAEVHRRTEALERALRAAIPELERVTVHAEPA